MFSTPCTARAVSAFTRKSTSPGIAHLITSSSANPETSGRRTSANIQAARHHATKEKSCSGLTRVFGRLIIRHLSHRGHVADRLPALTTFPVPEKRSSIEISTGPPAIVIVTLAGTDPGRLLKICTSSPWRIESHTFPASWQIPTYSGRSASSHVFASSPSMSRRGSIAPLHDAPGDLG